MKSLKVTVIRQLSRLSRTQFLILTIMLLAFVLALLSPEIRLNFVNVVGKVSELLCRNLLF